MMPVKPITWSAGEVVVGAHQRRRPEQQRRADEADEPDGGEHDAIDPIVTTAVVAREPLEPHRERAATQLRAVIASAWDGRVRNDGNATTLLELLLDDVGLLTGELG